MRRVISRVVVDAPKLFNFVSIALTRPKLFPYLLSLVRSRLKLLDLSFHTIVYCFFFFLFESGKTKSTCHVSAEDHISISMVGRVYYFSFELGSIAFRDICAIMCLACSSSNSSRKFLAFLHMYQSLKLHHNYYAKTPRHKNDSRPCLGFFFPST